MHESAEEETLILDKHFEFDDRRVAWGCMGEGPPIVLVHGFPWSSQAWRRIAPWLSRTYTVYYFDMLGCGESEKRKTSSVQPDIQNKLLAALIDHWQLNCPHVVGHDFGGLASLRAHLIDGCDYSQLTLVDSVAMLPSGSPFFAHAQKHAEAMRGLPEFVHEAVFHAFINYGSLRGLPTSVCNLYFDPWSGQEGKNAFYDQIEQSTVAELEEIQDLLQPLPFPVDIIWGEHDRNIPMAKGKELAEKLKARSFTPVPNAAHAVHEDAPEAILSVLSSG